MAELVRKSFAWSANPEADIAGYRILAGRSTGAYTLPSKDVGNVVTGFYDCDAEGAWFFALIAYNTSGQISEWSAELATMISFKTRLRYRKLAA